MNIKINFTLKSSFLWLGAFFLLFGTFLLQYPSLASSSPIPWTLLLIGNIIWMVDSFYSKKYEWVIVGIIFSFLDIFILLTRIF